jgi:CRISPR/Cas system-associated exonuclease Cas4 (RecB family)
MVIGGGEFLQPVLYALVVEKMLGDAPVQSGRLYFCTSDGEYVSRSVPLDRVARAAAATVADVVEGSIRDGFLPAAPNKGACEWCDFLAICGPNEERRVARKRQDRLVDIARLRETP